MTDTDPLAAERFRTVLTDVIGKQIDDHYDGGAHANEDEVAKDILDHFPEAHFEHRTNEHGVPMRRVAVAGEWEVDPAPSAKCPNCAPGYDCESGVYTPADAAR
jgi:hypothetical protein